MRRSACGVRPRHRVVVGACSARVVVMSGGAIMLIGRDRDVSWGSERSGDDTATKAARGASRSAPHRGKTDRAVSDLALTGGQDWSNSVSSSCPGAITGNVPCLPSLETGDGTPTRIASELHCGAHEPAISPSNSRTRARPCVHTKRICEHDSTTLRLSHGYPSEAERSSFPSAAGVRRVRGGFD